MKKFIFWLILVSFLFVPAVCFAVDEAKLISSAEKLIKKWEDTFSMGGMIISSSVGSDPWSAKKWEAGGFAHDIEKTDSIISPYKLTISFRAIAQNNLGSSNANYNRLGDMRGFKTAADAAKYTGPKDMGSLGPLYDCIIRYGFKDNQWILEAYNENFDMTIFLDMLYSTNKDYWKKNFLEVPID